LAQNRTGNQPAPESGTRKIWYQIGMTHSPEVGANFQRRVSAPISGMCVISLRKPQKITKTKLASFSLSYKSHHSKTANIKILSANSEHRLLTDIKLTDSFYAFEF